MPSRDALMLPDVLTEGDNLEMPPMPDASFLFSQLEEDPNQQRKRRAGSRDINLQEDYTGSQFLQNSIENPDDDLLALEPMDDLDLGLDFGLDLDDFNPKTDRSIEIGRDAPAARAAEEDLLSEMDVQLPAKDNTEFVERDTSLNLGYGDDDAIRMVDDEGDVDMFNTDFGMEPEVSHLPTAPLIRPERISESPLSDIDETFAAEIEAEHTRHLNADLYEPGDEEEPTIIEKNPAQRARKQKIIKIDSETTIPNSVIKDQQLNREKILKPQSFLPRDPEILALMDMQKNGGFVSSIMGGGRSMGWAPELRGILSFDAVRRNGELKRKRDSGIADMDSGDEQGPQKSPRLELGEEDDLAAGLGNADFQRATTSVAPDGTIIEMAADDDFQVNMDDDDHNASSGLNPESPAPNFDDTVAPLVHPADSGPVSLVTKHAVHLLRDQFGPEAANSPDKRNKASLLFQELLPEATTTKADATKMFFEILVLATKDAVKVEQQEALLGGPIKVRGKRGLWGEWAEREAGGEIAEEEAGPSARVEQLAMVSATA